MGRKNNTGTNRTRRPIESYEHRDKKRVNNPPAGLVTPETDPDAGQKKKSYAYDPPYGINCSSDLLCFVNGREKSISGLTLFFASYANNNEI